MAETWNVNKPLITNVVADDLADMNENFSYLLNRFGYRADPNEADQGAAGSGNSIKDLVDAIGVVKQATIFLPHLAADGNTTAYTFSTNETTPKNITLEIAPGALIIPDATIKLTVYSPEHIIAGKRQQIVDMTNNSTDPLIFTVGGEVYPDWLLVNTTPGTTVMSGAIQAAIESLESVPAAGGGTVKLHPGDYAYNAQLNITESYVNIIGSGRGVTTLKRITTADIEIALQIYGAEAQLYGNKVKDVTFDGVSSANFTGTNGYLTNFVDIMYGEFHNLGFNEGRTGSLLFQASGATSTRLSVKNILVTNMGDPDDSDANDLSAALVGDAIGLIGTTYSNFEDLTVINNGDGAASGLMLFDGSNHNRFNNILVDTTSYSGIGLDGQNGTAADLTRNIFSNIRIKDTEQTGIWVLSSGDEDADISGNIFTNVIISGVTGATQSGDGIRVEANNGENTAYAIQFRNIELLSNAGYGISNLNGQGCIFKGVATSNSSGIYYSDPTTYTDTVNNVVEIAGFDLRNSGTGTVLSGNTSIVVAHGLEKTPALTDIQITPAEDPTNIVSFWWISGVGASNFTINVDADPGASNLDFAWSADMKYAD